MSNQLPNFIAWELICDKFLAGQQFTGAQAMAVLRAGMVTSSPTSIRNHWYKVYTHAVRSGQMIKTSPQTYQWLATPDKSKEL